uniref:Uncharacterized protein n=1 Tax=Arundo donax TaxID=35708 RepID=A0A0A9CGC4_ARUDO
MKSPEFNLYQVAELPRQEHKYCVLVAHASKIR